MLDPIADHPDLNDEAWIREATKRARRGVRAPKRRKARRVRRPNGLVVAALVVAALLVAATVFRQDLFGEPDPMPVTAVGDKARPYDGTDAEGKPDGEAGIVIPNATPVGRHSAEQVDAAYTAVRDLLITARIDRRVVVDQRYDLLMPLISKESRPGARRDLAGKSALAWATVLDPGARLLPVSPKVDGRMRAVTDARGRLVIETDYAFAYAFDAPQMLAMMRYQTSYTMTGTGPHLTKFNGHLHAMSCDAAARGRLGPQDEVDLGPDAQHVDPFDLDEPLSTVDTCQ
ncbi:hypothetical protein GCM10023148_26770 [Actinokineospora soli]